jgi:RNase P/RNase MRP subunit POP5
MVVLSPAALRYQRAEHFRLLYKNGLRLFRIGKGGQVVAVVAFDRKTGIVRCHRNRDKRDRFVASYRLTAFIPQ